jgi:His-Xaa-Ser system protein HxsD
MKSNFEINGDECIIKINKNIYSKEIVVQTTYVLLDKFYFLIDCDDKYWIVSMKSKEGGVDLEKAVYAFFDELIESSSYLDQMKNTSDIRQMILERAILTQGVTKSND